MILSAARKVLHAVRRRRLRSMKGKPQWARVPAGFWMYIDPNEWLGHTILMGYFESDLTYFITQILHSGDTALDIGANQGYTALWMGRAVNDTGHILAIEPTGIAFDRLQQNIQRNQMGSVQCVRSAAGDCEGELRIWVAPHECGHSSVFNIDHQDGFGEIVRVAPADTIVCETLGDDALSRITFVKIDVEDYEPLVLDGMPQILHKSQPVLWIEVNPPVLAKGGYTPGDIERRLNAFGYRLFQPHFHRNAIGIPSLTLEPYSDLDTKLEGKMADMVAVVPDSQGWRRIQRSKIRILQGELTHA
jgi:FkbM family methyltransferase